MRRVQPARDLHRRHQVDRLDQGQCEGGKLLRCSETAKFASLDRVEDANKKTNNSVFKLAKGSFPNNLRSMRGCVRNGNKPSRSIPYLLEYNTRALKVAMCRWDLGKRGFPCRDSLMQRV